MDIEVTLLLTVRVIDSYGLDLQPDELSEA